MVEIASKSVYVTVMSNGPESLHLPSGWEESLARSKAQIVAGQRVALMPILDRLRASAERLEAEQGVTAGGAELIPGR